MVYPTNPIRIVKGNMAGSSGGDTLLGSATIPANKQGQVTAMRLLTGSPNTWFDIVHNKEGTIDTNYFEAAGGESDIGKIDQPIMSIPAGTVKVWVRSGTTDAVYGAKLRIDLV